MVQWVWTSWNQSFFNAIKWINLTSGWVGVHRHMPLVMPAHDSGEVNIANQHFSIAQCARRYMYAVIVVDDIIVVEKEIAPTVKEEEEKKEPGNDTKGILRDFHGYIHDEQADSR
ncbi:hypothetical protein Peur_072163 [Populus x canadensis]|jgi:hypothetical protein|uniref:Uncharacterized protein n=1 Tax=Populus deltoides TaxID=3696 RepID=A0A8T2XI13_POPDE|nr:hypothetical protein H0E87_021390 [Populus deltoides]